MSIFKLTNEILQRSQSDFWEIAKSEWMLNEIYESEQPDTCLCGHFPIIEICILENMLNQNLVTVGNCCVKKFIGLPSGLIFQAVKRIRKDIKKSLNPEAIKHAHKNAWINDWEFNFSMDTCRKRILSDRQMETRIKVNEKMLKNMKRNKKI